MKVLITGARGFIGTNLCSFLKANEIEVVEFDGLVDECRDVSVQFKDIDAVIHLAAYGNDSSHDQKSQDGVIKTLTTNIVGTSYLLTEFIRSSARLFIFAGSSSEYGAHDTSLSLTTSLDGQNPYAVSKASMSHLISKLDVPDKLFRVVRLFSVYGEHEKENRLIPTAFRCAETGETMPLVDGVHDFIHIDDVCRAFYRLLIAPTTLPPIIHAASGVQYSNQEVVDKIEKITGKKINTYPVTQMRSFDTQCWVSDQQSIAVKPKLSFTEGLTQVWSKRNNS